MRSHLGFKNSLILRSCSDNRAFFIDRGVFSDAEDLFDRTHHHISFWPGTLTWEVKKIKTQNRVLHLIVSYNKLCLSTIKNKKLKFCNLTYL